MSSLIPVTEKKIEESKQTSPFIISRSPPINIIHNVIEVHTGIDFTDDECSDISSSESINYISDNDIENSKNSNVSELMFGELEIIDEEKIGGWETSEYFEV